jgi:hypothetical protein
MSLTPSTPGTGPEQEESGPVGGKKGTTFGDTQTGSVTQEDSGPVGGNKTGDSGARGVTGFPTAEDSTPSRAIGHPARVDKIEGDV